MSVFNKDNTEWQSGNYSLFLGEKPALFDSINRKHQRLFDNYKYQKSIDWSEDEVDLEQSRIDLLSCPPEVRDIMLKNIAFQWELDSVASRSIAPLFAPFITDSDLWLAWMKASEIEGLHSLTYSEIVRQCVQDPQDVFKEVMKNEEVLERASVVVEVFDNLQTVGAKYILGQSSLEECQDALMQGVAALYCLERIQFMSSFAATFALAEQGWFVGIAKLVQKIMNDEFGVHCAIDQYVLQTLLKDPDWQDVFKRNSSAIMQIINKVNGGEKKWATYLFSEGRQIVGLNEQILKEWVDYNAWEVYDLFGIERERGENPIPFMNNWMNIDRFQTANQEADNTNYVLNAVKRDFGEEQWEEI